MEKIRIAVVGLGHRGRGMSLLAQNGFEGTEIVGACDLDPVLWNETQWLQEHPMKELLPNAKFFTAYEQMLDELKPDFVMVETGADVHADFCIKALNRNINVFSDIPSVATLAEADRLWKAQQASKGRFMTGANPNEKGFINKLVELYKSGQLGEPYYMEAEYIHASTPESHHQLTVHSPWRKLLVPIMYCTHSLGPLLRIMKEDLTEVICVGTGPHINPALPKNDMMVALFQTPSGVTIRLLRNGPCKAFIGHHSYRVFATKGYFERASTRDDAPAVTRFQSMTPEGLPKYEVFDIHEMPEEYKDNPKATGHGGIDYAMLDHMFQAYRENAPEMPIPLREGLRMTLPGIYAAQSARLGGQKLHISYPWNEDWNPNAF